MRRKKLDLLALNQDAKNKNAVTLLTTSQGKGHMFARLLSIATAATLLTSCATTSTYTNMVNGEYYDPNGWYKIDVPSHYCQDIEEHTTETMSGVAFHDEWGGLIRFEVMNLCGEELEAIRKMYISDPEAIKSVFFDSCIAQGISTKFPGTKVIRAEVVQDGDETMVYGFLTIPSGGTLVDTATGHIFESIRGYLIFMSGSQLVTASFQHSLPSANYYKEGDKNFTDNTLRIMLENRKLYTNLDL